MPELTVHREVYAEMAEKQGWSHSYVIIYMDEDSAWASRMLCEIVRNPRLVLNHAQGFKVYMPFNAENCTAVFLHACYDEFIALAQASLLNKKES